MSNGIKHKKFVVITRSRTGSNLLISLLNSHPNIEAYKELFARLNGKSIQDIWSDLIAKLNENSNYIGCKIFYYHPIDTDINYKPADTENVWNYLKKDTSIKIIHLKRFNMLRTFVSKEIAEKSNMWTNTRKEKKVSGNIEYANISLDVKKIEVNIDKCLKVFERIKTWEEKTAKEFSSHSYVEVFYETLVEDNQAEMNRIFEFFNIHHADVKSNLQKQNPEKLEDLIINYNELKPALAESRYAYLLKDSKNLFG